MSDPAAIVALIALLASLALAVRGMSRRGMDTKRAVLMGTAWAAIIAVLALLLQR